MADLKIKLSLESERLNIGIFEVETSSTVVGKDIDGVRGLIRESNQLTMSTKIFWCVISITTAISIYLFKH